MRTSTPEQAQASAQEDDAGRTITTADNVVIEGDNLPALELLRATHRGAVKVVYIDPPYNTGNQHSYRDRFAQRGSDVPPLAEAPAGSVSGLPVARSHVAWLDFMRPRLALARELMRADGVIFLHIDDRESAFAQLLGHEVFGEENFLGTLIHQRAKGGGNAKFFVRGHDYIHIWAKDAACAQGFVTEKKAPAKYEVIDGRRWLVDDDVLRVSFGKYTRGIERRLMYEDIAAVRGAAKLAEVDARIAAGEYILRPWGEPVTDGVRKHAVVKLTPAEQATSKLYSIVKALSETGRRDLEQLGLDEAFGYPKPVELLRVLVESQTFHDPQAVVLDFFAGSGTTGQAVMEANARDAGTRRFVLVQTPEPLRVTAGARTGAEAGPSEVGPGAGTGASGEAILRISALLRERLRRAGTLMSAQHPELDVSFRDVRLP